MNIFLILIIICKDCNLFKVIIELENFFNVVEQINKKHITEELINKTVNFYNDTIFLNNMFDNYFNDLYNIYNIFNITFYDKYYLKLLLIMFQNQQKSLINY